jgi:hypothetical protein
MSRRDDTVPMRQMLDHAREAVLMVRGRFRSDLDTEELPVLIAALARALPGHP